MHGIRFFLIITLLGIITPAYGQLSHSFVPIASIYDGGRARDIAQAPDGTIFLANDIDGLRAYSFDGSAFTHIAHINDGDSALGVAVASDSLVFLADGGGGLRAYSYDGASFSNTAHIDDGGSAEAVAVANDGTIFLANDFDGLRAYTYDGTSFTNTAHVNDGGSAEALAFAPDGNIFLANLQDGVRAYQYTGTAFINMTHIYQNENVVWEVAFSNDGSVLVGDISTLRVYTYQDTVYAEAANIELDDWPQDFAVTADNTILVANRGSVVTPGSLQAYVYNGATLVKTAHLEDGIDGFGIALASDGTILLANDSDGLYAYAYTPVTGIEENSSPHPNDFTLKQNYPNPFNPSTNFTFRVSSQLLGNSKVSIQIFDLQGRLVNTIVNRPLAPGEYTASWNGRSDSGKQVASGVYLYRMRAGDFLATRKMILLR